MVFFLTTARPISVIGLLVLIVTITESTDSVREGSHSAPRNDLAKGMCYSFCDARYLSSKSEPWLACHHGCRFLTLLGQMAGSKSARDVKRSCLSACTEAYNATIPERACHAGCEQMRGKKKKSVPERSAGTAIKTVVPAPVPTAPSQVRPNIRYFWSKSVVDEQDVDSSSEKRIDFTVERDRDPFLSVFEGILPLSFLPQSYKITKSTVTYSGSEALPSPPATKRHAGAKEATVAAMAGPLKEATHDTPPPSDTLNRQSDETTLTATHLPDQRPVTGGKESAYSDEYWKPGGPHSRPEIMLSLLGMSFFIAFVTLFRAFLTATNHPPSGMSFSKKGEAAGGGQSVSSEDDADSGDEFLGRRARLVFNGQLPPPSYEQAQQDLNAKQNRPLLVSLDLSTTNNMTC